MQKCNRIISTALLFLGTMTLLAAYAGISMEVNSWWPWNEIVHEGGELTLLWTVLYFEHASRELPLDIVLGLAVGASVFMRYPHSGSTPAHEKTIRSNLSKSILVAVLIIGTIVAGTLWKNGGEALMHNLLQMHTRPGAELVWGAHWRYHLLSRLSLMLVSLGFAGLLILVEKNSHGKGDKSGLTSFAVILIVYATISLVFMPDSDPFMDPVFLGHQIRELFTHALVTLPISWGVCMLLARDEPAPVESTRQTGIGIPLFAGLSGSVIGIYILVAALSKSAASHGQAESFSMLLFPHFFEHSFTYLVVPAIAVICFESLRLCRYKRCTG